MKRDSWFSKSNEVGFTLSIRNTKENIFKSKLMCEGWLNFGIWHHIKLSTKVLHVLLLVNPLAPFQHLGARSHTYLNLAELYLAYVLDVGFYSSSFVYPGSHTNFTFNFVQIYIILNILSQ